MLICELSMQTGMFGCHLSLFDSVSIYSSVLYYTLRFYVLLGFPVTSFICVFCKNNLGKNKVLLENLDFLAPKILKIPGILFSNFDSYPGKIIGP